MIFQFERSFTFARIWILQSKALCAQVEGQSKGRIQIKTVGQILNAWLTYKQVLRRDHGSFTSRPFR